MPRSELFVDQESSVGQDFVLRARAGNCKQEAGRPRLKRDTGVHRNFHELLARCQVVDSLAVVAPLGKTPATPGDAVLASPAREGTDVDFARAGFIRAVHNPPAIGGKAPLLFVKRSLG